MDRRGQASSSFFPRVKSCDRASILASLVLSLHSIYAEIEEAASNYEHMPTILIVEDEAKMRRLLELNLAEEGFTTLSAADAEAGLNILRENSRPGGDRPQAARDEWPGIPAGR